MIPLDVQNKVTNISVVEIIDYILKDNYSINVSGGNLDSFNIINIIILTEKMMQICLKIMEMLTKINLIKIIKIITIIIEMIIITNHKILKSLYIYIFFKIETG